MKTAAQTAKPAQIAPVASLPVSTLPKEELIQRLLAKAELDFRCCGHGGRPHKKGSAN